MRGLNTLHFNEATTIEAMEYWLRNKVFNKDDPMPAVKSVKYEDECFVVTLEGE